MKRAVALAAELYYEDVEAKSRKDAVAEVGSIPSHANETPLLFNNRRLIAIMVSIALIVVVALTYHAREQTSTVSTVLPAQTTGPVSASVRSSPP